MSHTRNTIITAITALLATAPVSWTRVFNQRIVSERVLDTYLMVYFENESSERLTIHDSSPYRCTVQFRVDATFRIADYEDLEAAIGTVAAEIQTKLTNSALRAITNKAQDLSIVQTSASIEEEQTTFALMAQTWTFTYMMNEGSPTT